MTELTKGLYDGMPCRIDISAGCYCNLFYCEHKFRAWSRAWFLGLRRTMPLHLEHPPLLFKVTA